MKKKFLWVLVCLCIAFIATGCSSDKTTEYVSEILGLDLSKAEIVQSTDSHGGFHGDGITYIEMTFGDKESEDIVKRLENNEAWNELPLSENLSIALYGQKTPQASMGPYVKNDDGKAVLPKVNNGYYFFLDRHKESKDSRDDTYLLKRASFNFTIAVYNTDNRTLHYCELDT